MKIITRVLSIDDLKQMADTMFGNLVKAVVDVDKESIAVDAELHSDLEALLIKDGSKQKSLWGINFYLEIEGDDFIEFDSMINIRPSQGNVIRGVKDEIVRQKIIEIVGRWIKK
ncbi:MAG: DUF5674 family protein [Candidatus Kaelpia imicola]|nr:DUF5674 family protein [Candidatus Kaelpia imicola]